MSGGVLTEALRDHPAMLISFATLLGLLFGSFLNVCISRWPANESVISPRSRCPQCRQLIAWYDNLPVASWLALGAKCRHCRLPIPIMYPAVEITTALIWGLAAWHLGTSVEMLRAAIFFTILLGIAMTDAREYIIPDEFSIGGAVLGILFSFIGGALPWSAALIGAVTGYVTLTLVTWIGAKLLKKNPDEVMGGGDIKMIAMLGAFLGWQGVLLTLFLGAVLGTVFFLPLKLMGREKEKLVPFGVFLAAAGAITYLVGDALIQWYWVTALGM